jgi:hypothetical protein
MVFGNRVALNKRGEPEPTVVRETETPPFSPNRKTAMYIMRPSPSMESSTRIQINIRTSTTTFVHHNQRISNISAPQGLQERITVVRDDRLSPQRGINDHLSKSFAGELQRAQQ